MTKTRAGAGSSPRYSSFLGSEGRFSLILSVSEKLVCIPPEQSLKRKIELLIDSAFVNKPSFRFKPKDLLVQVWEESSAWVEVLEHMAVGHSNEEFTEVNLLNAVVWVDVSSSLGKDWHDLFTVENIHEHVEDDVVHLNSKVHILVFLNSLEELRASGNHSWDHQGSLVEVQQVGEELPSLEGLLGGLGVNESMWYTLSDSSELNDVVNLGWLVGNKLLDGLVGDHLENTVDSLVSNLEVMLVPVVSIVELVLVMSSVVLHVIEMIPKISKNGDEVRISVHILVASVLQPE